MDDRKDEKATPRAEICDVHSFGATAARAFASLTAVEPEPAQVVKAEPTLPPVPVQTPRGLSAEAIRRIADRAEAASRSRK